MIDRLHEYGICLHSRKKYKLLDEIGENYLNRAVELVKSGCKFVFVLDNIDWEERVHDMRKEHQNKSVHAVATSIVFNRIPNNNLPDSKPQRDLRNCNVRELVNITPAELESIRKRYIVYVQNLLFQHFPAFESFKPDSPQATQCLYGESMSQKSEIVTMPVLMKDEKKYAECVDVLDQLEEWTYEIYAAAGMFHTTSSQASQLTNFSTLNSDLPSSSSRPDQPASHVPPAQSDDDPLSGIKVPCFGDQLTRVRLAGAKDLRSGCHTPKQRLDHLYPFCIVDWHTKRSFLKV